MNIEQKAREVVENILNFAEKLSGKPLNFRLLINIKTGEHYDGQDRMNGYVAAALQSAIEKEREECAKIAEVRTLMHPGEYLSGYDIARAIRARGQKA